MHIHTLPVLLYCSENIIITSSSCLTRINFHVEAQWRNGSFCFLNVLIIDLDLDYFLINGLSLWGAHTHTNTHTQMEAFVSFVLKKKSISHLTLSTYILHIYHTWLCISNNKPDGYIYIYIYIYLYIYIYIYNIIDWHCTQDELLNNVTVFKGGIVEHLFLHMIVRSTAMQWHS